MAVVTKKKRIKGKAGVVEEYEFWACDRDGRKAVGQIKDQTTGLIIDVCASCQSHLKTFKGFVEHAAGRDWV